MTFPHSLLPFPFLLSSLIPSFCLLSAFLFSTSHYPSLSFSFLPFSVSYIHSLQNTSFHFQLLYVRCTGVKRLLSHMYTPTRHRPLLCNFSLHLFTSPYFSIFYYLHLYRTPSRFHLLTLSSITSLHTHHDPFYPSPTFLFTTATYYYSPGNPSVLLAG